MTLLEARRHLFARQGLSLLPSKADAMSAMVAVQTQYAQSLGQALAARSLAPEPEYESKGLVQDGYLVKSWTLRGTVHTHNREDFPLVMSAVGPSHYRRFRGHVVTEMGCSEAAYDELEAEVVQALEDGPLTRKELHRKVPGLQNCPWIGWGGDVKGLAYRGELSFIGVGAEQRFARLHGFEPVPNALTELARRYFASYGPATMSDFRFWTGASAVEVKLAMAEVLDELTPVQVAGERYTRYMLGDTEPSEPRPAMLLAKFDPLLMGHRDRAHLFLPEHLPRVYRIAGQVEAVFVLNGEPAGTWRMNRATRDLTVTLEPWRALRKAELRSLEREANRLATSLGQPQASLSIL